MENKRPLDNPLLTGMITTGACALGLGVIIWLATTDFDSSAMYGGVDVSNPAGQFVGASIAGFGLMLLALGWAAAVICRQIRDTTAASEER
jgi:hypothetical protein